MRNTDRPRFLEILNGLASIKPGKELTKAALDIWWSALSTTWTIEEFAAAASHLATSVEFMPSPFHFDQLRKSAKPTAGEAWAEVIKRCKSWRERSTVQDLIDRVAAMVGGYRAIALADIDSALPHIERRFKEAYEAAEEAETVRLALPSLMPALEAHGKAQDDEFERRREASNRDRLKSAVAALGRVP